MFSRSHRSKVKLEYTLKTVTLYLFDKVDETPSKAPRLVAITLQRAHSDLLRLLHCHRHHMHGIIHQGCIGLQTGG